MGVKVPLTNTIGMYESSAFEKVAVTIVNGHITNPEVLKVGDALLYAGAQEDRTLAISHVEAVYAIASSKSGYTEVTVSTSSSGIITTASSLAVREGPSTGSKQVGTLSKGSVVYPTAMTEGWLKIQNGWISMSYVYGWIKDSTGWRYQLNEKACKWATKVVMTIGGLDYAFKDSGYMIESGDIASDGHIHH